VQLAGEIGLSKVILETDYFWTVTAIIYDAQGQAYTASGRKRSGTGPSPIVSFIIICESLHD